MYALICSLGCTKNAPGLLRPATHRLLCVSNFSAWVLPVAGFIVGWFTNFIALKVIFQPLEPRKICGYTLHGIFLKRQQEVAEIYARVVCTEILHVKAIFDDIFSACIMMILER